MTDKTASEPKWQQAWRAIVTAEGDVALAMENAGICKQFKDRNQCPCSKLYATSDPLNELWDECARLAAQVQQQAERLMEISETTGEVLPAHVIARGPIDALRWQAAEIERLRSVLGELIDNLDAVKPRKEAVR